MNDETVKYLETLIRITSFWSSSIRNKDSEMKYMYVKHRIVSILRVVKALGEIRFKTMNPILNNNHK